MKPIDYRAMRSLPQMLFDRAAQEGDRPFLHAKRGGTWTALGWREFVEQVRIVARALLELGVARGDRVALVAENRPEWLIADYAIMSLGAITVPGYATNTADDNRHIFTNAGVAGVIASTRAIAERCLIAAQTSPSCRFVIAIDPPPLAQSPGPRVLAWTEALALGATRGDDIDAQVATIARDDLACVIHTSGTGGLPKGVSLAHGAILTNCRGAFEVLKKFGLVQETLLCFLPLSHAYEHTVSGAFMPSIGAEIWFAESTEKLAGNIAEVRPTLMTAVPRLYETLYARISQQVEREGGLKAKLFAKTLALGRKRYADPHALSLWERLLDALLERLVREKIRARFGGRLKAFVSGGAPLSPEIGLFFTALGVRLLQGYGQTETAPVVCVNPPDKVKLDTVGPPFVDVEMKIAADGEILVRGECVMKGYWNDEAATAAAIKDGWLHTGDIGEFDADGYLKITDRKKDFIKNSGGDMIAPARIEGILALQPEIAQVMLHGDRRPYLVAVVVPREDRIKAAAGGGGRELAALRDSPQLRAEIDAAIARVNRELPAAERIRKFILAETAFTLENEMMTPTMKIRRHKIRAAYGAELEALYG
jgi:long-chain acyl-CoA synthetase